MLQAPSGLSARVAASIFSVPKTPPNDRGFSATVVEWSPDCKLGPASDGIGDFRCGYGPGPNPGLLGRALSYGLSGLVAPQPALVRLKMMEREAGKGVGSAERPFRQGQFPLQVRFIQVIK